MNWKETFEQKFGFPLGLIPTEPRVAVIHDMQKFIETEIIEKLIEEIPDYQTRANDLEGTKYLADDELSEYVSLKKQLRAEWLGKESNV